MNQSILELEQIEKMKDFIFENNSSLKNLQNKTDINAIKRQLEEYQARLVRMVASFDEITTELYDRSPIEENIIPEITFNFKIRLSDKLAPLYVFFSYPENQHNKAISLYISYDNKDPSSNSNMASYFNPSKICI